MRRLSRQLKHTSVGNNQSSHSFNNRDSSVNNTRVVTATCFELGRSSKISGSSLRSINIIVRVLAYLALSNRGRRLEGNPEDNVFSIRDTPFKLVHMCVT